ncbi:MAG TPA: J domain-containing protein [Thermoanaerobaculia bacterium]|nr:J domain-containing protein [Thermoanaerobaculia bacterium]
MSPFDPYEVLEIPRDADPVTVRRAYQRLARRLHPDLQPGDAEAERRYEEVARAYRVLADPELRRRWEEGLLEAGRRTDPGAEPGGGRGGRGAGAPVRLTLESFLEVHAEWISTEGKAEPGEPRGEDLTAMLTLDFADAVRGVTTSFSVQRERECEECAGEGETLSGAPCERCGGRGVVVDLDRIRVRIPQGVEDGSRLRLPGKGALPAAKEPAGPAPPAGNAGDLFLTVRVRPHPYFRRRGLDVLGDLPVTFAEAALGADVEVPTLDGPVKVRLPAGTSGGQRFRLRGRGVTLPSGRAGDHYYTVRIVVPERLDDEARALVERLPRQDPRRDLPREPV